MGSLVKPHTCLHCFHDCEGEHEKNWYSLQECKPRPFQPFVAAFKDRGGFFTPPAVHYNTAAFYTSDKNGLSIFTLNNGYYLTPEKRRLHLREYNDHAQAHIDVSEQFTHWHPIPDFIE